jgi:hypothetical protein
LVKPGTYYLNIGNQLCRDENHGLQVLLIEGSPCLTSTYKIKKCIAKIYQDDLFIELDSLKQGIDYLLNIDGFLGDYCEFQIQLATQPQGFPQEMHAIDTESVVGTQREQHVHLKWTVEESLAAAINGIEIWRKEKSDKKYQQIKTMQLNKNTYGSIVNNYEYTDTIRKSGEYSYRIIGVDYDGKYDHTFAQKTIYFQTKIKSAEVTVPLNYVAGTPVKIIFFDPILGIVLKDYTFILESKMHQKLTLSLSDYISINSRRIDVVEQNLRTKKRIVYHYSVSPNGEVISVR